MAEAQQFFKRNTMDFKLTILLAMFFLRTMFVDGEKNIVQKPENGSNFKLETDRNPWVKLNVIQQKRKYQEKHSQTNLNVESINSQLTDPESNFPTTTLKLQSLILINEDKNKRKSIAANKRILQNTKAAKLPTKLTKSSQLNVPLDQSMQKSSEHMSNNPNINNENSKLNPFLQQLVIDNPKIESILDSMPTDNRLIRFPTSFVNIKSNGRLGLNGNDESVPPSNFDNENSDNDGYSYITEHIFQQNADLFNENGGPVIRDEQDQLDIIEEELYEKSKSASYEQNLSKL